MEYTTLDSYGESSGCFLSESDIPQETESSYRRHRVGGHIQDGKEEST